MELNFESMRGMFVYGYDLPASSSVYTFRDWLGGRAERRCQEEGGQPGEICRFSVARHEWGLNSSIYRRRYRESLLKLPRNRLALRHP